MVAFYFGVGSAGTDPPSYSIRIPFVFSPNYTLKLEGDRSFDLLGYDCEITHEPHQYVLTVRGFASEDAASAFLPKICAGLLWFGLSGSAGCRFSCNISPVKILASPQPIKEGSNAAPAAERKGWLEMDGHYDAANTVVYPEHKKLFLFGAGSVTASLSSPISVFSKRILEGIAEGQPELVISHPKLRLACEVYHSSHFESTPAASFLSRITALEILANNTSASEPVLTLVRGFMEQVEKAHKESEDEKIKTEFTSLIGGLERHFELSITRRLRNLVYETLREGHGCEDAANVAREISQLYRMRSNLVHDGKADAEAISKGNNRLNEIVPQILKSLYREVAKID